jgi:hypothetical protein
MEEGDFFIVEVRFDLNVMDMKLVEDERGGIEASDAFIPAVLSIILIVVRTALEDSTLQKELPGYLEYVSRVGYKLIPWVW